MAKIYKFLCKLLPLLKSHAEYSRKTADDFNELVLEVEDILLDVEAPDNQVPEEEEYDLEEVVFQFDEMMKHNPIKDLVELMARRNELKARKGRECNGNVQEVSAEEIEESLEEQQVILLDQSEGKPTTSQLEQNIRLDEPEFRLQINPTALGHEECEIKIEDTIKLKRLK